MMMDDDAEDEDEDDDDDDDPADPLLKGGRRTTRQRDKLNCEMKNKLKSADSYEACLLLICCSASAVFIVDMSAAAVDMSASRPLDY